MLNYFIIPGLGNSGPQHWQTYFESSGSNFRRIIQREWDKPDCQEWVETVDQALMGYDLDTVVLIGHSLGCATIAHWAAQYKRVIKGAMLVAPSDVEAPNYKFPTTGFAPMPKERINFRTIVVASSDDLWVTHDRAKYFAQNWGSGFVDIGQAGHINAASGHFRWEEGLDILKSLI